MRGERSEGCWLLSAECQLCPGSCAGHSIGQGQEEEQLEMGNVAELGAEDGNR